MLFKGLGFSGFGFRLGFLLGGAGSPYCCDRER